jgi:hypothetical protein
MASKKRTRLGTFTHMTNLIGTGRELMPCKLPTVRDVIRYGVPRREESGDDKSLQAIGGDSTNVNTVWEGGTMHWVVVKLGRKLIWLVCALHTTSYLLDT